MRLNEDNFIVVAATVPGDHVTDVTMAFGPDGTCACKVSAADDGGRPPRPTLARSRTS